MNGVIWSKTQDTFVPIFSVPAFAAIRQERLRRSRELEIHNFELENITLTSFEEQGFLEFEDNNTRITGACGDLWNILSQYLNFTLQPVRSYTNSLGNVEPDQSYKNGLLGIIYRNETIAIPKVETYAIRLTAVDFTMPLWMGRHQLFVRREVIHDSTWMIKVFTWDLWCFILAMHVVLTIFNFWSQHLLALPREKMKITSFSELLFYSFGHICNQSYSPTYLESRSRILEITLGLFCSVTFMAFNAILFTHISKGLFIPPFNDMETLVNKTKYNILYLKGSIEDIAIKTSPSMPFTLVRARKRATVMLTVEKMFKKICSTKYKYAVFQGADAYNTKKHHMCQLVPIDTTYLQMWIASGLQKNFKYKRSIDLGILRAKEVGLWSALKSRWWVPDFQLNNIVNTPKAIEIDQVSLMIAVMGCGVIMALVILIIEKAVSVYKHRQS